jgi:hypothetical protein
MIIQDAENKNIYVKTEREVQENLLEKVDLKGQEGDRRKKLRYISHIWSAKITSDLKWFRSLCCYRH